MNKTKVSTNSGPARYRAGLAADELIRLNQQGQHQTVAENGEVCWKNHHGLHLGLHEKKELTTKVHNNMKYSVVKVAHFLIRPLFKLHHELDRFNRRQWQSA